MREFFECCDFLLSLSSPLFTLDYVARAPPKRKKYTYQSACLHTHIARQHSPSYRLSPPWKLTLLERTAVQPPSTHPRPRYNIIRITPSLSLSMFSLSLFIFLSMSLALSLCPHLALYFALCPSLFPAHALTHSLTLSLAFWFFLCVLHRIPLGWPK